MHTKVRQICSSHESRLRFKLPTSGLRGAWSSTVAGKLLAICSPVFALAPAFAAPTAVDLQVPIMIEDLGSAAQKALAECAVQEGLTSAIQSALATRSANESSKPAPIQLKVTLTELVATGGGGWSGAKSMVVKFELLRGSNRIAARRFSRRDKSLAGIVSGTCPMIENLEQSISADMLKWLDSQPTSDLLDRAVLATTTPTNQEDPNGH